MKTSNNKMNEIIKEVYTRELELIEDVPATVVKRKRKSLLKALKNALWAHQSAAIKLAIFALTLAVISAGIYYYNLFIVNQYQFMLERAQIEAHLQRRNDLIPNLVAAVSDYMVYEQKIFIHAADVRAAVKMLEESVKADQSASIMSALSKFQAVAENYPNLKASNTYQTLMKELSGTETQIAQMRLNYNQAANYYNSRLKMFPGYAFNLIIKFKPVTTFEAELDAKIPPKVK